MTRLSRRKFLSRFLISSSLTAGASACFPLLLTGCASNLTAPASEDSNPRQLDNSDPSPTTANANTAKIQIPNGAIKVGLLHSLSGPMAISEMPLIEAERLAIDEINNSGGILGKPLAPLQEDGASDWPTFAEKAEKLIDQEQVAVLFGGLTSASRKAILPVVKAKNHLLWYPGAYEGQECASHIFYAGTTANQQIEPAVDWLLGNRGKSFFLVSANERTIHDMVRNQLKEKGGQLAGEAYIPPGNRALPDMATVMDEIQQALPEGGIIFNSLRGEANQFFFQALQRARLSRHQYLVMSIGLGEEEVSHIGPLLLADHYAAGSYFQTVSSPASDAFVSQFKARYGQERVVSAAAEAAYAMVHLWAKSVAAAQSLDSQAVRQAAYGQTFAAPSGTVTIQPNHHLIRASRIGKIQRNGQFEVVMTQEAIAPNPWSRYGQDTKGFICDWSDPEKGAQFKRG